MAIDGAKDRLTSRLMHLAVQDIVLAVLVLSASGNRVPFLKSRAIRFFYNELDGAATWMDVNTHRTLKRLDFFKGADGIWSRKLERVLASIKIGRIFSYECRLGDMALYINSGKKEYILKKYYHSQSDEVRATLDELARRYKSSWVGGQS